MLAVVKSAPKDGADGTEVRECPRPKPIASAVFCHGNSGNLTNFAEVMPHLVNAGYNVLLFDYRGFGKSTGRPSLQGVIDMRALKRRKRA